MRIYGAAGPLVLARGVRRTTIRDIARAAYLSPGGIFHYFASKGDVVLYGLEPEALSRACTDASAELREALAAPSPDRADIVALYVEKKVRMLEFVRPALLAAVELGRAELRQRLSAGLRNDADALVSALAALGWHAGGAEAEASAEAIRRTILGLALDDGVTPAGTRAQPLWLFERLVPDGTGALSGCEAVRGG